MNEKLEEFVAYFRDGNATIYDIRESGREVRITFDYGHAEAVAYYDGYTASIVHYNFPIEQFTSNINYKVNNINNDICRKYKIEIRCDNHKGKYYLTFIYCYMTNDNPYMAACNLLNNYNNTRSMIENYIQELVNYI